MREFGLMRNQEFYHLAHTAVCAALRTLAQTEGAQRIMVLISSSQFSFMEGGLMSAKSPLAGLLGADYGECYYALLSRAEFSEELRSEAARDEQLLLYNLPDLLAETR